MTRRRHGQFALLGGLFASCVGLLLGCGGARAAASVAAEPEATCVPCFSDRWEQAPPQIGQTPPEEAASAEQIDAFEAPGLEGSGGQR